MSEFEGQHIQVGPTTDEQAQAMVSEGGPVSGQLHLSDKMRLQAQYGDAMAALQEITDVYDRGMTELGVMVRWGRKKTIDPIVHHAMEILPHLGAETTATYLVSVTRSAS